jgi:hypothetical protein|tara:strand:+ start:3272 stop:3859 length:588 start_codon:yes stop_codon:yes gene_type:complete
MRTVVTKVFTFDELSDAAKETAIDKVRDTYYEHNDFAEWAIDDCSLLEPPHKELEDLLGESYNFPLLRNTRKDIYFSLDRDRHIDISNAMEVTDTEQFLKWLGIDSKKFLDEYDDSILEYQIGKDTIEFEPVSYEYDFTEEQESILDDAKEKFEGHCGSILDRLVRDIDYRFTCDAITDDIQANEFEFTEDGLIF